ncbi:hypothetical protein ACFVS2_21050 [Brevibacillus sp. NPDC058079]|uniref:hypothetical protein n=1 Tax=Brevibacillus sp. NPDC058079 TaxID=3346330 RepID=UPI0036E958C9
MVLKQTWKMRDRRMRAWVYEESGGQMVYSQNFVSLSRFYAHLEDYDNYDLMDWINEKDIHKKDIFEADIIRANGGLYHDGFWERDITGVVEYRGTSYGIVDKEGIFHPFDIAFDGFDIKFEVISSTYESSTGHEDIEGAVPVVEEDWTF